MPHVVDLDALIPEDIEFPYRGESYLIPGDIKSETAWKLVGLYQQGVAAQQSGTYEEQAAVDALIEAELLTLLQVRQPELAEFPFGMRAGSIVLAEILVLLGFEIVVTDEGETPPTPNRAQRRAASRSRRSSGSPK